MTCCLCFSLFVCMILCSWQSGFTFFSVILAEEASFTSAAVAPPQLSGPLGWCRNSNSKFSGKIVLFVQLQCCAHFWLINYVQNRTFVLSHCMNRLPEASFPSVSGRGQFPYEERYHGLGDIFEGIILSFFLGCSTDSFPSSHMFTSVLGFGPYVKEVNHLLRHGDT